MIRMKVSNIQTMNFIYETSFALERIRLLLRGCI